jgi:hypothetical protein
MTNKTNYIGPSSYEPPHFKMSRACRELSGPKSQVRSDAAGLDRVSSGCSRPPSRHVLHLNVSLGARGDDEAEAGVGAVVARERIGRTHAAPSAPSPRDAGGAGPGGAGAPERAR